MPTPPTTPCVIVMAALLERQPAGSTERAPSPSTSRDRQVVAIARAHLDGERELVDALGSRPPGRPPRQPHRRLDRVRRGRRRASRRPDLTGPYTRQVLSISVLGPVEVRRAGELVPIPAGKTSELLVRLALDAGVLVRTDRLVDDLWADDAVRTSRNTLQSKVAKLRRALGDPSVVVSGDGGYTLVVDPADVDALAVLRNTSVGGGACSTRATIVRAADLCASTLTMFRGDVLVGAGDGDWVTPHRARLEEARIEADRDGVLGPCSAR